jgi:hypothetical protein
MFRLSFVIWISLLAIAPAVEANDLPEGFDEPLVEAERSLREATEYYVQYISEDERLGWSTAQIEAVRALSRLRSPEIVPFCIENINVMAGGSGFDDSISAYFPCVGYLATVGTDSVEPLIEFLDDRHEMNESTTHCATSALVMILGRESAGVLIKQRLGSATDPVVIETYRYAAENLNTMPSLPPLGLDYEVEKDAP